MLKNLLTESYLHQFVPEPELTAYLWAGETNYSDLKTASEQVVLNDFINRGYSVRLLRPELALSTSTGEEDIGNRNRIVVVASAVTGTATVTITGSDDDSTYTTAGSLSVTATGTTSGLLTGLYKYYKYSTSGTITITSVGLVESNYDLFYAYKWLELIFMSAVGSEGDVYDMKRIMFKEMYNELFASAKLWIDTDEDGELNNTETINTHTARLIR